MSRYSDLVLADDPALYWALDATNGATDLSGNSRDGTAAGDITIGGFSGSPLSDSSTSTQFDGTNDRISSTYNPFSSIRTFMGWAYRDTSTTGDVLMGGDAAATHPRIELISGASTLRFDPDASVAGGTVDFAWPGNAQWVHWALVFAPGSNAVTFYANGALVGTGTTSEAYPASPGNLLVGARGSASAPFVGKMAGVAVFTRELAASTIRDYYSAAAGPAAVQVLVREKPPLRLSVNVETPGGRHYRWGADEPNPANNPSGISFSTVAPGGFETSSLTLPRKPRVDYGDLERLSTLKLTGAGGQSAGEYRLESTPRVSGDQMAVSPGAVGWQAHLDDDKSAKTVFIDRDLGNWTDPSLERRLTLLAGSVSENDISSSTGGQDSGTLAPGLSFTFQNISANNVEGVERWYYGGGSELGEVRYDFDVNDTAASATFADYASLSTDDLFTTSVDGTTHNQTDASDQSVSTTLSGYYYARVRSRQTGGNSGELEPPAIHSYVNLRVFGNHGLTAQGTQPAEGFYASDVIAYAIQAFAPLLNLGDISSSGFAIPQLAFREPTTCSEMVSAANRFHLWDWMVWEDRTFYYHERGGRGKAWRARVSDAKLEETGPQTERLWNGVIVRYNDVDGSTRTVGPEGSGANTETSEVEDADPLNPANQLGIRRWDVLDMGGVSTPAGATEVGSRFLEQAALLNTSGRATLVGHVEDDRGVLHPAWKVRAGDTVTFVDASDTSPRRIVRTSYEHGSRTCSVDLDSPPEGLNALLERLQVVLVPLGIS